MTAHGICGQLEIFESARHFESKSNRDVRFEFELGRPILIGIESRSFAGPYPIASAATDGVRAGPHYNDQTVRQNRAATNLWAATFWTVMFSGSGHFSCITVHRSIQKHYIV